MFILAPYSFFLGYTSYVVARRPYIYLIITLVRYFCGRLHKISHLNILIVTFNVKIP